MGVELDEQVIGAIAVAGIVFLLLLIWIIVIGSRLKRLRRQYRAMMDGTGVNDLEGVIRELQTRLTAQEESSRQQREAVARMAEALERTKGRIGVHRYNAFSEQGSDLSFSIAIIDDHRDGVVLSGLHSREETYVYAKPLQGGESAYTLSPEEKVAINQAAQPQSAGTRSGERT